MKNSWKIFSNDIKNVGTNWVALVIIGGLIILPSLYAWLNIKASWDPYGQTEQIPVGIVNEDVGETIRDENVDVGGELVDTLKDNDTMEWHFLNRKSAMDQLEKGDLFAVVIIPKDFSQSLGTVIKPNPRKANVEYYVNEKLNAIAPKITQKGASVIVDEISSNFISTVNGVIFDIFNEIGLELEADLPDIERFENYVFEMESRLPEIHETLEGTLSDANEAKGIVSKAQKAIPEAEGVVGSGLETIDNTTDFLEQAENRLHELEPKIEEDLKKTQETAAVIHSFFDELDSTNISFDEGKALKEDIRNKVDDSIERIEAVENTLAAILEQMKNEENPESEQVEGENNAGKEQIIQDALDKLNQIKSVLEEGRNNTDEIDTFIDKKKEEVDHVLANIKELSSNVEVRLGEFMKEYNESIKPTVLEEVANAKNTLSNAKGILVDVQATIPEVENLLNRTSGSLDEGKGLLEEVLNEYPYVNDKINELATKIRDIQGEADIQKIIELLQNDPEAERGFFAEPVKLKEHSVFPIENYGTGMTPFYTILSLWVGGLLLISLLTTDVNELDKFGAKEIYFGKLFTFAFIGFLQTFIVTTGDIFLINVEMAHPFWFVLFGLFCSFIFITIIYTFVSILGDVGKALAIVMLVLQIAG
ncbi:MAG TPA: YhgE/Pip domain-containing protein, partial [Virgibacillus sp.]